MISLMTLNIIFRCKKQIQNILVGISDKKSSNILINSNLSQDISHIILLKYTKMIQGTYVMSIRMCWYFKQIEYAYNFGMTMRDLDLIFKI